MEFAEKYSKSRDVSLPKQTIVCHQINSKNLKGKKKPAPVTGRAAPNNSLT
jgi:hypothetical protein